MIITQQKSMEEIQRMLKPYEKVFVIGCGTCSTTCQTGGEEQVKEIVGKLDNKKIVGAMVVESPCDARLMKRDSNKYKNEISSADALLCLSCGAGVQNIVDTLGKVCVPGLDTKFIGKIERIGMFYERCRACGDCVLFETGGICPIVRCPKGMLNGPCGGMFDGKCEVGKYKNDCAWVLIYNRLRDLKMLEMIKEYKPPRDNSKLNVEPREIVWVGMKK
jgi:hypothetical protein